MYIDQMKLFVSVVNHKSISQASVLMNLSQSAVSQSIAKLEQELGTPLLIRTSKGIEANREGMIFYRFAQKTLLDLELAQQEIRNSSEKIAGLIRLQILATSALIPQLISEFISLYPDVQFKMVQSKHVEDFDVCITTNSDPILPDQAEILMEEEICLAVPPNMHPFSEKKSVHLLDLKDKDFIMMRHGSMLRTLSDELCTKAGFEPGIVFESDNPSIVREMVSLGLGVAFLPKLSWSKIIDNRIHLLRITQPKSIRQIYIYSPESKKASNTIHTFINYAKQYYQKSMLSQNRSASEKTSEKK